MLKAYLKHLVRVQWQALAALMVCAGVAGVGVLLVLTVSEGPRSGHFGISWITSVACVLMGLLPVVLYGAPAYAFVQMKYGLSWPIVVLLGLAPGLGIAFVDLPLAGWVLCCGLVVAVLTRFFDPSERRGSGALTSKSGIGSRNF